MERSPLVDAKFPSMPPVREIATGHNSPRIATANLGDTVSTWDLSSARKLSQFSSFWDIGGRRLAISEDGRFCCTGSYERHGVTLYESSDGKLVWQRRDLRKVQNLRLSLRRNTVFAGIDRRPFHILDASTGADIETIPQVIDLWENPHTQDVFLARESGENVVMNLDTREKKATIKSTTFAILDACFAQEYLAISEAAGPTSLYSVKNGALVWRYSDPQCRNGDLAYHAETHEIMAFNVSTAKGGGWRIVALDLETGRVKRSFSRTDLDVASFALGGTRVVTWCGSIVDTESGEELARLPLVPA